MDPNQTDPTPRPSITGLVPWLCLLAASAWTVLLRVPLVVNARIHLDSDLAVDGLTLLEAVQGHWRWHYPGTPFSGTIPVLLSYVQAGIWGATPEALVSGGVVAHLLLLVAVFGLAWRCFGRIAAIGSLVPLTFASTGVIWLSGRITGGHLLVVAFSAAAWLLLARSLRRGHPSLIALLGAWCGLGLYLDSMFLMTLVGMTVAALRALADSIRSRGGLRLDPRSCGLLLLGFVLGVSPAYLGRRFEPHDAYHEQFATSLEPGILAGHAGILVRDCLPRLLAGHRLPGLEADPDPQLLGQDAPFRAVPDLGRGFRLLELATTVLSLALSVLALAAMIRFTLRGSSPVGRAIAGGVLATSLAVVAGFLLNRNIFNSDNYRYLVLLLIPWALGFGLWLDACVRRAGVARALGIAAALGLAALFTADAAAWYRRMGWMDDRLMPIRRPLDDPALRWLGEHPEVRAILGGYWDVYRLSFLSEGAVRGVPYAVFPNRFPEWSRDLPEGRPETLVARPTPEGRIFLEKALRGGGEVLFRRRGLTIVRWPWPGNKPSR